MGRKLKGFFPRDSPSFVVLMIQKMVQDLFKVSSRVRVLWLQGKTIQWRFGWGCRRPGRDTRNVSSWDRSDRSGLVCSDSSHKWTQTTATKHPPTVEKSHSLLSGFTFKLSHDCMFPSLRWKTLCKCISSTPQGDDTFPRHLILHLLAQLQEGGAITPWTWSLKLAYCCPPVAKSLLCDGQVNLDACWAFLKGNTFGILNRGISFHLSSLLESRCWDGPGTRHCWPVFLLKTVFSSLPLHLFFIPEPLFALWNI